jgi:hypothetical protein
LARTFIEHWNGRGWKLLKNPAAGETSLDGVAATSPCNAWAVGSLWGVNPSIALIMQWNGRAWKQVSS